MDKVLIKGLNQLKNSEKKIKILKSLNNNKVLTPTEMSRQTNIVVNHISTSLKELKDNKLVTCLNENDKRGRLYQITDNGKKVLELL